MNVLVIDPQQSYREGIKILLEICRNEINVNSIGYDEMRNYPCPEDVNIVIIEPIYAQTNPLNNVKDAKAIFPNANIGVCSFKYNLDFMAQLMELNIMAVILKSKQTHSLLEAIDCMVEKNRYFDQNIIPYVFDTYLEDKRCETSVDPFKDIIRPSDLLSTREWQVLELMTRGLSNEEISNELYITKGTVQQYAQKLQKKLGVENRVSVVMKAIVNGWIQESVYRDDFK